MTALSKAVLVTGVSSGLILAEVAAGEPSLNEPARAVFEETETVLALTPASQAAWAREYADRHGTQETSAADVERAVERAFPKDPPATKVKIRLITLMVMMGDIVGALRSYAMLQDRQAKEYNRTLAKKLDSVQKARSKVIRNFARTKPPHAYGGKTPTPASHAQDTAARYTQFAQISTQLMNEFQGSERDLVDRLQDLQRNAEQLWETYSSFREEESRTNERLMRW